MESLAANLQPLMLRKRDSPQRTIITMLLSGVSGSGKGDTCDELRSLLAMQEGQLFEQQFVSMKMGDLTTDAHINRITGSGPSFVGYGDPCLVTDLIAALKVKGHPNRTPPYIYLCLDEIDKTCPKVMNALNSLLDTGELSSGDKKRFQLPVTTTLLVVFTANFGEHSIERSDLDEAERIIQQQMNDHGFKQCDVGRIQFIVPFFKLSFEDMRRITLKKAKTLIGHDQSLFSSTYGAIEQHEDSRFSTVDTILRNMEPSLGVRGANALFQKELFYFHRKCYDEAMRRNLPRPLPQRPTQHFYSVCMEDKLSVDDLLESEDIAQLAVGGSVRDRTRLENCYSQRVDLNMMVMRYMDEPLAASILPPAITINIYNVINKRSTSSDKKTHARMKNIETSLHKLRDEVRHNTLDCSVGKRQIDQIRRLVSENDDPLSDRIRRILEDESPVITRSSSPLIFCDDTLSSSGQESESEDSILAAYL